MPDDSPAVRDTAAAEEELASDAGPGEELEPAPQWMVTTVYVLLFLFVQGTIYRILWPEEESTLHYLVFFVASVIPVILFIRWRKSRARGTEQASNES